MRIASQSVYQQNVGISHNGLVIWRVKDQLGIIYINFLCIFLTHSHSFALFLRVRMCIVYDSEWVILLRTKNGFNVDIFSGWIIHESSHQWWNMFKWFERYDDEIISLHPVSIHIHIHKVPSTPLEMCCLLIFKNSHQDAIKCNSP